MVVTEVLQMAIRVTQEACIHVKAQFYTRNEKEGSTEVCSPAGGLALSHPCVLHAIPISPSFPLYPLQLSSPIKGMKSL